MKDRRDFPRVLGAGWVCGRRASWLTALILLAACADPVPPSVPTHPRQRGLWVWSNLPAFDLPVRQQLFAQTQRFQIDTWYAQAQTLVYDHPVALRDLVFAAADRKIAVELLAGNHGWARAPKHQECLKIVTDLAQFVAEAGAPRPTAIHLNVEPHALPEWATSKAQLAGELLDLLAAARPIAAAQGLALVYDMPNWYNDVAVTRQGQTRPLSQWIADAVDRVVVMDYRDDPTAQLWLAKQELDYGRATGKPVVVAAEAACGVADEETYCEEGATTLQGALDTLTNKLTGDAGFAGIAVHHFDALAPLPP